MRILAKRAISYAFLLIFIGSFLFLPKIGIAKEISVEDLIANSEKIQLEEDEGKHILRSLLQELHDEWEAVVVEGGEKVKEKEVILLAVKKAVQKDLFNYVFLEAPKEIGKEIIKIGAKIVAIVWGGDPSTITKEALEEIEKLSVEKAKEYVMEWLLQNQIKVIGGNLSVSYYSLKAEFQHIIIYRPVAVNEGRVNISIYSSSVINNIPYPGPYFQWEGGIDKLPPFILEIEGMVKKDRYGSYVWTEGPEMNYIFDQRVPEFTFKEIGFFDKWRAEIKKSLLAFDKLKGIIEEISKKGQEYGGDFWEEFRSVLSDLNPFQATVNPENLFPEGYSEVDFSEIEAEEPSSETPQEDSEVEELEKEPEEELDQESGEVLEKEGKSRQDVMDDILERIDILNSRIDKLNQKNEDSGSGEEKQEEKEDRDYEEDEKEEEEDEEEEDDEEDEEENQEESNTGGGGGSSEPDYCNIPASDPSKERVILNEIAWMGTESSSNDEWIELKNISDEAVNVNGWQIIDRDGQIKEILVSKELQPGEFYLLERTDDSSVPTVLADLIYTGGLNNTNEALYLFDNNCQLQDKVEADPDWPAGNNENKKTMERGPDLNWHTFSGEGNGTPKSENSSLLSVAVLDVSPKTLLFESKSSSSAIIRVDTKGKNLGWTASSSAAWLEINPVSATSSQDVSVSVDCGNLSPGDYSADIIFSTEDLEETVEIDLIVEPEIKPLDHLVISEVQLGDKEFVELYNPKNQDIDLSSFYFSYYSSSREEWNNPYRNKQFSASSTISAKGHYLIGFKGYPDVLGNPASDWQIYSSSQLSDSEGSIAIFPWNPLEKSSEEAEEGRIDAVGWGNVSIKEGESCGSVSEGKSLNRINGQDTDFNSFDFEEKEPTPINSKNETYSIPSSDKFAWPMIQQNPKHTGRSKHSIPENLEEKWSLVLEDSISGRNIGASYQPIIGKDDIVYYVLRESSDNVWGRICAVDPNGNRKWSYELDGDFPYAPSIGSDGTIYVPTHRGFVYALNPQGKEKWRFDTGEEDWISKISIGEYHNIYFTDYKYVYSVDSKGDLNWKNTGVTRGGSANLGPAIGEDGTIYVSWTGFKNFQDARTGALYAYNPVDGSEKWHTLLDHDATSPVVGADNKIYLIAGDPWAGHEYRTLRAFNPDTGEEAWRSEKASDGSIKIPLLSSDNRIIITDSWGEFVGWSWGSQVYQPVSNMTSYNFDGDIVWESEIKKSLTFYKNILVGNQNKILTQRKVYDKEWKFPFIKNEIELFGADYSSLEKIDISGEFLSSFSAGENHIYFIVKDNDKIMLKAFGEGPKKVKGCTDPEASNYNSEAEISDDSCVYEIKGCTDPEALNYNPEAVTDDGSCIVPEVETDNLNSVPPLESLAPLSSSSTQLDSSSIPFEIKEEESSSSTVLKEEESVQIESGSSTPDIFLKKNSSSTQETSFVSGSSSAVEELKTEKIEDGSASSTAGY